MKRGPIVHPTDFSPASQPALREALARARAGRAPLLIAHVLPVLPMFPDAYVAATTFDRLVEGQRAQARRQLARLVRRARASSVRASGLLVDVGATAERIVRLARAKRARMIVMGTHGRSGVARAIVGSVAARVLATAACPVLTVRAR
jgi:nucleotide-binding universal stress UspA family protein